MPSSDPTRQFNLIGPLLEVRQVTVEAQLHKTAGPVLDANVHQDSGWTIEDGYLVCTADCKVEISQNVDGESVFTGRVVYAAVYQLVEKKNPTEASLRNFMEVEVIGTLEPYIRESLQSLTLKSGLPPFVLPHYRSLGESEKLRARRRPAPRPSASKAKNPAPVRSRAQIKK
jgi:preprotein translocase subunit SecB